MELQEQLEKFHEFLDLNYKKDLNEIVTAGKKALFVDFSDLAKFDPELADMLLSDPTETIKAAELSLQQFDIPNIILVRIRFFNLPETQKVKIRDIRSEHIDKFIFVEGLVRQASDVRPQAVSAKFECPACGNVLTIPQLEQNFREPSRCSCGRKGRFRLLSKDLVDAQRLVLEESPESLEGGEQPKRLSVFIREDLVEPRMEKRTTPGTKVKVCGVVKEVPIPSKTGSHLTRYDLAADANNLEAIEETYEDIIINKEDERKIKQLAKDPEIYEKLVRSIAPSIFGHEDIKGALILQLMGGVRKEMSDGTVTKGDIHVLLVGDPGAAKSTLLMFMSKAAPKCRYVVGRGSSAAGLCIAPDSLVCTNPGGIHEIKEMVEQKLENNSIEYAHGIWQAKNTTDNKKIFTLDENLKIKPKEVEQFWKITPPAYMIKLKTRSGKEVIVTPNTKLFSIENGDLIWKEAEDITAGEFLAGTSSLHFENHKRFLTVSLIKSNPIVYGVKKDIKKIIDKLCKDMHLNKRELARELKIKENKPYHHWINENARGNIHLKDLLCLVKIAKYDLEAIARNIESLSLRKGDRMKIPTYLNAELLYLAGLIAGDGDITGKENSISIRLSNNSKQIQKRFRGIATKLFNKTTNLSHKRSEKRAEAYRFHAKLIAEILDGLGIPKSPKSDKIDMKNTLLKLPNSLVGAFLKGYFDADGGPVERYEKGSSYIEAGSVSKIFMKKLQLVLLRFGIQSKVRVRNPKSSEKKDGTIINAQHQKNILVISGKKYLELFRDAIGFNIGYKKRKLDRIINAISVYHTNVELVPGANKILSRLIKKYKIKTKDLFGYDGSKYVKEQFEISSNNLKRITDKLKYFVNEKDDDFEKLNLLANADIIWEKITEKEKLYNHKYDFVYDLTVEDSHNFIVNGLVVHNTAAVVKDEFLKGWALEAGALVLANNGFLMLDEMDKMTKEDTSALHEGMAQQQITISKANIQATLRARTTILAAANPKFGRFDPYQPIAAQIDLPPTLINRFDLIFPVRDIPNKEKDTKIATHVLEMHQHPTEKEAEIPIPILKKYVAYVRQKIMPQLTEQAMEEIKTFYVDLRNSAVGGEEGSVKPIPISARQLEALVRLAEGSARVRLSSQVTRNDAKKAISILRYCLMAVGFDYETGQIDIDRISTGIPASTRNKIIIVREIIKELEKRGKKAIPLEDILAASSEKNLTEGQVEEIIEKLKREGELFEPRRGFIQSL